ncbi:MAG TPA: hypothetical protein VN444_02550, partial [Verrucomicrobiae bacterium]|nr:hypothetical protein [Verrucomicrobiae bacterium]
ASITRLLGRKKRSLAALLAPAKEVTLEGDRLIVMLENGTTFARSTLDDLENRRLVTEAASEAFGRPMTVECRFDSPSNVPARSGSTQPTTGQGELRQPSRSIEAHREARDPQQTAVPEPQMAQSDQESLRGHPLVQRAMELFDGQVVRVRAKQPE